MQSYPLEEQLCSCYNLKQHLNIDVWAVGCKMPIHFSLQFPLWIVQSSIKIDNPFPYHVTTDTHQLVWLLSLRIIGLLVRFWVIVFIWSIHVKSPDYIKTSSYGPTVNNERGIRHQSHSFKEKTSENHTWTFSDFLHFIHEPKKGNNLSFHYNFLW